VARVTVRCAGCGVPIEKRVTEVAKAPDDKRWFCTIECVRRTGAKPRRGETRKCAIPGCEGTFYARTASDRRYCSARCKDMANRNRRARDCLGCGTTFELATSEPDVYCSRECYIEYRRKAAVGRKRETADGYVVVFLPGHSEAQATGWVMDHRAVMVDMLGRPLLPGENVHHKNGQRDDNDPGNLELWVTSQPSGKRPEDLVAFSRLMLSRYGDDAERGRYGGVPPE